MSRGGRRFGPPARAPDETWVLRVEEDPLPLVGLPRERVREGMKLRVVGRKGADGRLAGESYGIVAFPDDPVR